LFIFLLLILLYVSSIWLGGGDYTFYGSSTKAAFGIIALYFCQICISLTLLNLSFFLVNLVFSSFSVGYGGTGYPDATAAYLQDVGT
jgi:hypothetical protein